MWGRGYRGAYWIGWSVLAGHRSRTVMRIKRLKQLDLEVHYRKRRQKARRIITAMFGDVSPVVTPLALDIVNGFNSGINAAGQRAWPEIAGEPPVFGNAIGEIGHTSGGSWIWTGFSWERAILGG